MQKDTEFSVKNIVKYTPEPQKANDKDAWFKSLKNIQIKNWSLIILADLNNINLLRNKFELLTDMIIRNVEVLVKLDEMRWLVTPYKII